MKKNMKRIVTLVLCAVMALGLLAVSASADVESTNGLMLSKTITPAGDRTYTVKLEAYATGSASNAAPEIALVLDESSSMDKQETTYRPIYGKDTDLDTKKTYYVNIDGNYVPVKYCDDTHLASGSGLATGKGWYTGNHFWGVFHWGYRYRSMRSAEDSGSGDDVSWVSPNYYPNPVQFYESVTSTNTSKMDALKAAAKSFVEAIHAKAGQDNYTVSVIGYKDDATGSASGLKIGATEVKTEAGTTAVKNAIDTLSTGSTSGSMADALGIAQAQFSSNQNTQKIVVVFSSADITASATANSAITAAKALKDRGITIYTVGMMDVADPTLDITDSQIRWNQIDSAANKETILTNARLQAVSSNFPNATACGSFGNKASSSYYRKATNQDDINAILNAVSSALVLKPDTMLDSNAVLRDEVSQYFEIVGTPTVTGTGATVTHTTNTIAVTGFDYAKHFRGENANYPETLTVIYTIKAKDAFLGGNGVPTQGDNSGIYENADATVARATFSDEAQDVPLADLTVTAQDKNVYLTTIPTADQMKEGAEVKFGTTTLNLSAENYGLAAWQTAYISSISLTGAAVSTGFDGTADGTYTLTGTITSGTASKTFSASANILVFKPVLTYSDETIYLSQSPTLTPTSTVWKHGETASTAVTMLGSAPTLSDYAYSTSDFSTCQTGVTLTGLKVGGTTVTSGFTANPFAVHVLKPTLTASDVTIYRGSSVSLNGQVSISAWACSCTGSAQKTGTVGYGPAPSYSFNDGAAVATPAAYSPEDCKAVTASWTLGGQTFSSNQFRVHVLQPGFTVNTNDVWADYGVVVDLAANCVDYTTTPMTWKCSDNKTDTTAPNVKGTVPTLSSAEFTFGTDTGSYTVGEADQTFQLTAAKFTFSNGYAQTENYTDESFTVHVNTFDLTINKTWSGADCYKQDTIFIITRANGGSYSGGETLRVVIPKDKGSVTIAGLLCGQQYQVKEDTGWSWRWKPAAESFNVSGRGVHDAISKTKLADFTKKVTFTNTLNSNKTQWLSGSDCVNNVYNNNGWSQVTAGIVNKARQALHLG